MARRYVIRRLRTCRAALDYCRLQGSWLRESGIMYNPIGLAMVVPPLSLFFTIAFGLMRRMRKEDEAMRELFGTEWDDWAGKVKFKLFPYIY